MWEWFLQNMNAIGVIFAGLSFIFPVMALAFSALRYVAQKRDELKNRRFERYHSLLLMASRGTDANGPLKLVSQRAFIYELRFFPEYGDLTKRLLESLLSEWKEDPATHEKLAFEVQDRGSKPEPPKIPSADQRGLSRARSMG